jgi:hypothetical protein
MILDNVKNIEVPDSLAFNEINTLGFTKAGMDFLYQSVDSIERPRREHDLARGMITTHSFGRDPDTPPNFLYSSPSIFNWYSISLVNYVRLVGFIHGLADNVYARTALEDKQMKKDVKKYCDDYVSSITEIQDIVKWRNKVSAHYAITDPRNDDNPATLDASIMHPVGYCDGRYKTSVFVLSMSDSAGLDHTSTLPSWSLTETHEFMIDRFWTP